MPGALESAEYKGTARAMNSNEVPTTLISGAILLCPFNQSLKSPPLPGERNPICSFFSRIETFSDIGNCVTSNLNLIFCVSLV